MLVSPGSSGAEPESSLSAAGVRVTPIGRAEAIPADAWDRLASRGHHLHRWFVAAESGALQPRHLAIHDAEGLRAIVPAYLEAGGLHGDLHDRWFGAAGGSFAQMGVRLRPSLAVVLPLGTASEPLGGFTQLPDAAVHATLDALEAQARNEGAQAVVFPFVTQEQDALLRIAAGRGYARAFAGSTARLDVEWSDFEGYLASRSRNVRRTIRAELHALSDAGLELRRAHDFRAAARPAESLYRDGFRRRNGHFPTLDDGFFSRIAEPPADSVWAQIAWHGDALIGFSLNMAAGGRVDGGLSAFADVDARPAVYAADLVYEPVRIACERGYRSIELGPTALQAKRLRGATLIPRYALVRGLNRRVHGLLLTVATAVDAWTRHKERRSLGTLATRRG